MTLDIVLLILLTLASIWTVMRGTLIRAAISLAVTSIILTLLMFRLGSPLAAVFELSVCAGLITVVFMSTISMTKAMTHEETLILTKARIKRFWYMPVIVVVIGVALAYLTIPMRFALPPAAIETDVRRVLWNLRQTDILGQVLILLVGVFGIVVLFKEKSK